MSNHEIELMADRFLYCLRLLYADRLVCRERRAHKLDLLSATLYEGGAIHFERN